MYNLFKKLVSDPRPDNDGTVTVMEEPVVEQSVNEIIEEIHESFYTEVEKLLAEAKISKPLDSDKQDLIDKYHRLKALGFNNTKEVQEAQQEVSRLQRLQNENQMKAEMVEVIEYFTNKYPNYKFITEESVKRICNKYGLVYGGIGNYVGTVPDKNLREIENFKIEEEDKVYIKETSWRDFRGNISSHYSYINKEGYDFGISGKDREYQMSDYHQYGYYPSSMEIAAPKKDFNMDGMEVKDHQIVQMKKEIPDPIVLQPVLYKGQRHFLIISAWGQESTDPEVINQKMN